MTEDDVRNLAREELDCNGLMHWNFQFNNSKANSGLCDYEKKTIYLSRKYYELMDNHEIHNTILHEIAHVLTPGDQHGKLWQQACEKLGIQPIAIGPIQRLPGKYSAKCSCGNVWYRYNSKCLKRKKRMMCSNCFEEIIFTKGNE